MKARTVSPILPEAPEERVCVFSIKLGMPQGQGPSPASVLLPPPPGVRAHLRPDPPHLPSASLTLSPLSSSSLKNQSDCRGDKKK